MGTSTAPAKTTAETIYERWDDALGRKDVDAALALYADDASIESPLVRHLLDQEDGVVRGRDALRHFLGVVFSRSVSNAQVGYALVADDVAARLRTAATRTARVGTGQCAE